MPSVALASLPVDPAPPVKMNSHASKSAPNGTHGKPHWEVIAARKRQDREAHLSRWPDSRSHISPSTLNVSDARLGILTPRQIEITSLPAHRIVQSIAERTYTSAEVVTAFIRAAVIAQDATNCLTELCFADALDRARELDEYQERTGRTTGPLHGLPVSIKDHIDVRELDSSTGFVGWCYERIAEKDAVIVRCLRKAGAVIYCKTANPQSLLVSCLLFRSLVLTLPGHRNEQQHLWADDESLQSESECWRKFRWGRTVDRDEG